MLPMLIVLIAAVATVVPAPAPIAKRPYPSRTTAQVRPGNASAPALPAPPGRVPALRMPVVGTVVRGFETPAGQYGPGHRESTWLRRELVRAPNAGRVVFAGPVPEEAGSACSSPRASW
jgi:hypothetical protein